MKGTVGHRVQRYIQMDLTALPGKGLPYHRSSFPFSHQPSCLWRLWVSLSGRWVRWKVIWVFKIRIYYTIVFARKDQDLSYKLISSPLPGYSLYTRGAVVTFGNTLFLWASLQVKKHLQVSSKISLFYKHLPKQIIIACVHISCIQVSKQPRASSLQNLKFFTGLGRCQQWQGQQAPLITKG